MTKPTWIKVVGIMGIILGGFSVFGSVSLISTPQMLKTQQETMLLLNHPSNKMSPEQKAILAESLSHFEALWDAPKWYNNWCEGGGLVSLGLAIFYIVASTFILSIKKNAVRLFFIASGLKIIFAFIHGFMSMSAFPEIGIPALFAVAFTSIFDVILIIVVAASNKDVFRYAR